MEWLWLVGFVVVAGGIGLIAGSGTGTSRDETRARGRWDQAFEIESRRIRQTDATGVLRCRACGANGYERAGRCPRCGAIL